MAKFWYKTTSYGCAAFGALGNERHLWLECPAMQSVREKFAQLFAKAYIKQLFPLQDDFYAVPCYFYACLKLPGHGTLLEGPLSTGVGMLLFL